MQKITDLYVQYQKYCRPNLDIGYRCILRCPQCIRQRFDSQAQIKRSFDIEEKDFQKILNYYKNSITFCGQISDPIYHPNFLKFLKLSSEHKKLARIATNGTGKSLEWWEEAYSYGKKENAWYFGVDGIDEKSEIYRVGSNYKNVWEMMKLGKNLGNIIVWQFIIFGYNEHEIEQAKEIAKKENFSLLFIKTNRGFDFGKNYRKNVEKIKGPSNENRAQKIKNEFWGYKTSEFIHWQQLINGFKDIEVKNDFI